MTGAIGTTETEIHEGYRPGLIGAVTELHARYYAQHYGFGAVFERKGATELAEFAGRLNRESNTAYAAYRHGCLVGAVSMDGEDLQTGAMHLRWFIVADEVRGAGPGRRLLQRAIDFADRRRAPITRLWTFRGLDAARRLYEDAGFSLANEQRGTQWGTEVIEQEFVRPLPDDEQP